MLFSNTNRGISYSRNKINAIMVARGALNEIVCTIDSNIEQNDINLIENIVDDIIEKANGKDGNIDI